MIIEFSSLFFYVLNSTARGQLQISGTKWQQGQNKVTNEIEGKSVEVISI
jgi:hypothetical protein